MLFGYMKFHGFHGNPLCDMVSIAIMKRLTSWFSFVMSNCDVGHFPIGILGQVWCLIVLIPDLCPFLTLKNVGIRTKMHTS